MMFELPAPTAIVCRSALSAVCGNRRGQPRPHARVLRGQGTRRRPTSARDRLVGGVLGATTPHACGRRDEVPEVKNESIARPHGACPAGTPAGQNGGSQQAHLGHVGDVHYQESVLDGVSLEALAPASRADLHSPGVRALDRRHDICGAVCVKHRRRRAQHAGGKGPADYSARAGKEERGHEANEARRAWLGVRSARGKGGWKGGGAGSILGGRNKEGLRAEADACALGPRRRPQPLGCAARASSGPTHMRAVL